MLSRSQCHSPGSRLEPLVAAARRFPFLSLRSGATSAPFTSPALARLDQDEIENVTTSNVQGKNRSIGGQA